MRNEIDRAIIDRDASRTDKSVHSRIADWNPSRIELPNGAISRIRDEKISARDRQACRPRKARDEFWIKQSSGIRVVLANLPRSRIKIYHIQTAS